MFGDFVDLIYPIEIEMKDTTIQIGRSVSYLDLHLTNDSEGRLRMKLCDKRDDSKKYKRTNNNLQSIHIKID
jgi:hypothetical protein